jgi:putative peptidoglycan lipid II flippase
MARGFLTVGAWTGMSRVLGFIRDVMIAGLLGAGPVADAFFVAFRLPNMFRRFFAEGAFNMAFVPLFSKRLEGEGLDSARRFAEEALAVLVSVLLGLTVVAMLVMPGLVWVLAAGFADDPERFGLAVLYARIQFPYLLCMSATALFSGILNAMGRFAAPAAAPVLLNVILIGAMALAAGATLPVGTALAVGVLLAGFAQVALVAVAAQRAGLRLGIRRPKLTAGVRRLIKLGIPGAAAGGVLQINLLIGTIIASFFDGAVSWLSYAERLYQLPLGIIGIAIGVVLLPELSRRVRAGDRRGGRAALNRAAEFALVLTIPAAAALVAIPGPIVSVLFERGAFGPEDATAVAWALALFAIGLPSFVLQKVVQPAFFAREDTVSPLRFAAWSVLVNIALSVLGAPFIGYLAIPLATSIGGWVHLMLLLRGARRYGTEVIADRQLRRRVPRFALAAAFMAAVVFLIGQRLVEPMFHEPGMGWVALGLTVASGLVVYAYGLRRLNAASVAELRAALRR